jgi:hypothetical protein
VSSYSAALAAPPAGEIAEREEDDDDDDDPQDDAEDAHPLLTTHGSLRPFDLIQERFANDEAPRNAPRRIRRQLGFISF